MYFSPCLRPITCAVPVLPALVYWAAAEAGAPWRPPPAAARVGDGGAEPRPERDAAVGERGDRLRERHGSVGVVALADADRDRLAGIPLLLLGAGGGRRWRGC